MRRLLPKQLSPQSLWPDEPLQEHGLPACGGAWGARHREGLQEKCRGGNYRKGHSRTALVCRLRAKATPHPPPPPAHSALARQPRAPPDSGEDAALFNRERVGSAAMPAAQVTWGWCGDHGSGAHVGPVQADGGPQGPGATWGPAAPGLPPRLPSLCLCRARCGPRAAYGLGLRAVYELQQVLHSCCRPRSPVSESWSALRLLFLPLGQP